MKRNVFEDFKVMITLKNNLLLGCPFWFKYTVEGDKNNSEYIAEWTGNVATSKNVKPVDGSNGKQFYIIFEKHNLPCGRVLAQRKFTIYDADFSDGNQDKVYNEVTEIELADGVFENVGDITGVVGINVVKPVVGVDYYTDADKTNLINSVKTSLASQYYNTGEVDAAITAAITEAKAAIKAEYEAKIAEEIEAALADYAKTEDIPSLEGYLKTADAQTMFEPKAAADGGDDTPAGDPDPSTQEPGDQPQGDAE